MKHKYTCKHGCETEWRNRRGAGYWIKHNGRVFSSAGEAARVLDINHGTVIRRLKESRCLVHGEVIPKPPPGSKPASYYRAQREQDVACQTALCRQFLSLRW